MGRIVLGRSDEGIRTTVVDLEAGSMVGYRDGDWDGEECSGEDDEGQDEDEEVEDDEEGGWGGK